MRTRLAPEPECARAGSVSLSSGDLAGLMEVDGFGQLPGAPWQQRPHSGGADNGSANKRAPLTNAQAPGHAARLGARQPGQHRTDHLFLRCPEQHRRALEPTPERRVGAWLSQRPRLAGGPVIARRTIDLTACLCSAALGMNVRSCRIGRLGSGAYAGSAVRYSQRGPAPRQHRTPDQPDGNESTGRESRYFK
jgi:hypothetical protein